MAAVSTAAELNILINVIQDEKALGKILSNFQNLIQILRNLNGSDLGAVGGQVKNFGKLFAEVQAAIKKYQGVEIDTTLIPPSTDPIEQSKKEVESEPVFVPAIVTEPDDTQVKQRKRKKDDDPLEVPAKIGEPDTEEVEAAKAKIENDSVTVPVKFDPVDPNFSGGIGDPNLAGSQAYLPSPVGPPIPVGPTPAQVSASVAAQAGKAAAFQQLLQQSSLRSQQAQQQALAQSEAALKRYQEGLLGASKGASALENSVLSLNRGIRLLAGGFLAYGIVRTIKSFADAAAEAQVLQTTLHVVALNAGITDEAIDKVDRRVQRLGITAQASRQALTQLIQAKIPLDLENPLGSTGERLARLSQDLAVVSRQNSSETFQRLLVNLQQLDTLGLRFQGIIVDRERAYQKFATANNLVASALTKTQQVQALTNETFVKGEDLAGAYVKSMFDVGKQIQSLDRLFVTLRTSLGDALLPAYSALIAELSLFLQKLTVITNTYKENTSAAEAFGQVVQKVARIFFDSVLWLVQHKEAVLGVIGAYALFKATVLGIKVLDLGVSGILLLTTFFTNATGVVGLFSGSVAKLTGLMTTLGVLFPRVGAAIKAYEIAQGTAKLATLGTTAAVVTQTGVFGGLATSAATAQGALATFAAAWGTLAVLAAIPLTFGGYIIFKDLQDRANTDPLKRGLEARKEGGVSGLVNEAQAIRDFAAKPENKARIDALRKTPGYFENVDDQLTLPTALVKLFREAADEYGKIHGIDTTGVLDSLDKQGQLVQKLDTAYKSLGDNVSLAQKKVALAALNSAKAEEARLRFVHALSNAKKEGNLDKEVSEFLTQYDKVDEAQKNLREAVVSGDTGRKTAAEEEYNRQNTLLKNLEGAKEERLKLLEKTDPQKAATNRELAALKATAAGKRQAEEDLQKAERDLFGEDAFSDKGRVSSQFGQKEGAVDQIIQSYVKRLAEGGTNVVSETTRLKKEMQDGIKELTATVSTPEELRRFREQLQSFTQQDKSPEGQALASNAIANASRQVLEKQREFNSKNVADRRQYISLIKDQGIEAARAEVARVRQRNQETQILEDVQYEKGLISLSTYYANRGRRIVEEGDLEVAEQEAQIAKLEASRKSALTSNEELSITNEITKTRKRVVELQGDGAQVGEIGLRYLQNEVDGSKELEDVRKQIKTIQLEHAANLGSEAAQIALINQKYDEQLKTLKLVGDAREALNADREYEIFQVRLENINRRLEESKALRQTLQQQDVNRTENAFSTNRITEVEYLRTINTLTLRQASYLQDDIQAYRERKTLIEEHLKVEQARAKVLRESPTVDTKALKIVDETATRLKTELDQVNIKIIETQGEFERLVDSMDTYGRRLATVFRDSLANALSESLTNFREAGNAFQRLSESIQRNIADAFSRNLSSKITQSLVTLTSQKFSTDGIGKDGTPHKKGDAIPGTSIFDSIFKFFGLGGTEAQAGDTPSKPIHARITNVDEFKGFATAIDEFTGFTGNVPYVSQFGQVLGSLKNIFKPIETAVSKETPFASNVTAGLQGVFGEGLPFAQGAKAEGTTGNPIHATIQNVDEFKNIFTPLNRIFSSQTQIGIPFINQLGDLFSGIKKVFGDSGSLQFVNNGIPYVPGTGDILGRATGGLVEGPGTGTSDSIPTMLSDGEYVIPAKQTSKFLPVLEAIRTGAIEQLASGGRLRKKQKTPPAQGIVSGENNGGSIRPDPQPLRSDDASVSPERMKRYQIFFERFLYGHRKKFVTGGSVDGDAVPAMVSAGEYVMPERRTKQWFPLLEAIRSDTVRKYAEGGLVQSIAPASSIPYQYAGESQVVKDGGSTTVNMSQKMGQVVLKLDPNAMNMTLRDWLERTVAHDLGRS